MFSFRRPEDSGSTKTNISWKPDYMCRNSLKKKKIEKKSAALKFLTRQLLMNLHKLKNTVGTSVEDNPQIFSSKLVNLPGRFFFMCDGAAPNSAVPKPVIPPRVCETKRHLTRKHATVGEPQEEYSTAYHCLSSVVATLYVTTFVCCFATTYSSRADVRSWQMM